MSGDEVAASATPRRWHSTVPHHGTTKRPSGRVQHEASPRLSGFSGESFVGVRGILSEIDAHMYELRNAARWGASELEIRETQYWLAKYREQYDRILRGGGDVAE